MFLSLRPPTTARRAARPTPRPGTANPPTAPAVDRRSRLPSRTRAASKHSTATDNARPNRGAALIPDEGARRHLTGVPVLPGAARISAPRPDLESRLLGHHHPPGRIAPVRSSRPLRHTRFRLARANQEY